MINWIIGGIIIGSAVFIIVRMIVNMAKGESTCCSGCNVSNKSRCNCVYKP